MSAWLKVAPAWLWWLLALVLAVSAQQYRVMDAQRALSNARTDWSEQLRLIAESNAAVILKQQADRRALEGRLTALDTTSTEKLTHAQDENNRLRNLYGAADDERRRLRIEVRVARADATVSAATSPGGMGDAASVELSAESGSAVWDIRGGMISDRAKLEHLQQWAREVTKED